MNIYHPFTIFPLGDSALTIDFGNFISESLHQKVMACYQQLQSFHHPFITDIIPAYSSLTVAYDVARLYPHLPENKTAFDVMAELMEEMALTEQVSEEKKTIIRVPVCYDEKFAPDLQELAREKKMVVPEVIRIHTSISYRVYMLGFLPGFAYMGEVDDRIAMARKKIPRTHVPAGSVGIAGKQTGIYPLISPGGWQLIGRTPLKIFNSSQEDPVVFHPGEEVQFYSISEDEYTHYQGRYS